jgi:hypothetical protein
LSMHLWSPLACPQATPPPPTQHGMAATAPPVCCGTISGVQTTVCVCALFCVSWISQCAALCCSDVVAIQQQLPACCWRRQLAAALLAVIRVIAPRASPPLSLPWLPCSLVLQQPKPAEKPFFFSSTRPMVFAHAGTQPFTKASWLSKLHVGTPES